MAQGRDEALDLQLRDHGQLTVLPDQLSVRGRDQGELVPLGRAKATARRKRNVLHGGRLHRGTDHRRPVLPRNGRMLHRDLLPRGDVDEGAPVPVIHPFVLVHLQGPVGVDFELDPGYWTPLSIIYLIMIPNNPTIHTIHNIYIHV